MSNLADELRQFWLIGLNEVNGKLNDGLADWLQKGAYRITTSLQVDEFVIDLPSGDLNFQRAIAQDLSRMSMASFETISGVQKHPEMPRSMGWHIIQTYYATFFAAHALLRSFGISLTQLDTPQTKFISDVADTYGFANNLRLNNGFYVCSFDPVTNKLLGKHAAALGGSHEVLWRIFIATMIDFSNQILIGSGSIISQQQAASKLIELCDSLKFNGCNGGNWLSQIRNYINYKHEFGAWFPYKSKGSHYEDILLKKNDWKLNPDDIIITPSRKQDLRDFLDASNMIISLLKFTVLDMSKRCPKGNSFHKNTTQAVLNFLH